MNGFLIVFIIVINFIFMDLMYKFGQEDALKGKTTNNFAIIKVNKSAQDSIKLIPKMFEEHSDDSVKSVFDICSHVFMPIDGLRLKIENKN